MPTHVLIINIHYTRWSKNWHPWFIDVNNPPATIKVTMILNKCRYQSIDQKVKFKRDCSVRYVHHYSLQYIRDDDATHWCYCLTATCQSWWSWRSRCWCTFTEVIAKLKQGYHFFGPICTWSRTCLGPDSTTDDVAVLDEDKSSVLEQTFTYYNSNTFNKKAALPQGNRVMPQLFWSVFTAMLLHFLFQFLRVPCRLFDPPPTHTGV